MTSTEKMLELVSHELGRAVNVFARRPGRLFQVELPAYLADGDAAMMFIETTRKPDRFIVSDLAQTLTRLSYANGDTDRLLQQLSALAEPHGFSCKDGAIRTSVPRNEIIAAILGLAQIESAAESAIRPSAPRAQSAEFRKMVLEVLKNEFRERLSLNVSAGNDPEKDFAVDAIADLGRRIGIAVVPNNIDAERAVGTRYAAADSLRIDRWIAVPKDINALTDKTRSRLMKAYWISAPEFESDLVRSKIKELAA